jgi:catalase (peroxidase I)
MTDAEARALHPGDRIRLRPQSAWEINPPQRTVFTVAKVDFRGGSSGTRIVSVDGFRFIPWEVEKVEAEGRG